MIQVQFHSKKKIKIKKRGKEEEPTPGAEAPHRPWLRQLLAAAAVRQHAVASRQPLRRPPSPFPPSPPPPAN